MYYYSLSVHSLVDFYKLTSVKKLYFLYLSNKFLLIICLECYTLHNTQYCFIKLHEKLSCGNLKYAEIYAIHFNELFFLFSTKWFILIFIIILRKKYQNLKILISYLMFVANVVKLFFLHICFSIAYNPFSLNPWSKLWTSQKIIHFID